MVAKTITRKKNPKIVKEELLDLLRGRNKVGECEFNIHNIINQGKAIDIIKHYEKIIKMGSKKRIRYEAIQGQMLKKFKDKD